MQILDWEGWGTAQNGDWGPGKEHVGTRGVDHNGGEFIIVQCARSEDILFVLLSSGALVHFSSLQVAYPIHLEPTPAP